MPDSNRMGFRLAGPALARAESGEILSEPTCLGTVQVPASGQPIVDLILDKAGQKGTGQWTLINAAENAVYAAEKALRELGLKPEGARAFAFGPPPLPGYGSVSGFTLQLQDRSGGSVEQLAGYVQQLQSKSRSSSNIWRQSLKKAGVTV